MTRMMIVLIARVVPQPMSSASRPCTPPSTDVTTTAVPGLRPWLRRVSPVDVPEDEVERRQDRDHIGHEHAAQQPRQDRHVAERRRTDLHSERAGRALGDYVVAHLPE